VDVELSLIDEVLYPVEGHAIVAVPPSYVYFSKGVCLDVHGLIFETSIWQVQKIFYADDG
jgi:hypothetical protein